MQAEKEWEARFKATVLPVRHRVEVLMTGVMRRGAWHSGERPRPILRVVSKDPDAYEIPEFLRKQAE